MGNNWCKKELDLLIQKREEGLEYKDIVVVLNEKFKRGRTVSSVSKKYNRYQHGEANIIFWDNEKADFFKPLYYKGLPYTVIAEKINKKFNSNVEASAVKDFRGRLKIKSRDPVLAAQVASKIRLERKQERIKKYDSFELFLNKKHSKPPWNNKVIKEKFVALYKQGYILTSIAYLLSEEFGYGLFSKGSISGVVTRNYFSREGVKKISVDVKTGEIITSVGASRAPKSERKNNKDLHERLDEIKNWANAGMSLYKMSRHKLNCSKDRLKRFLHEQNIEIKPQVKYASKKPFGKGIDYNVVAKKGEGWYIKCKKTKRYLSLSGTSFTREKVYAWRGKSYQADAMMRKAKGENKNLRIEAIPESQISSYELKVNGVG